MQKNRAMRHLLAFAAALLIAVIGFMPKAAWAEAATVDGTPYDTVSEAIEKAPDGGTVTLTDDARDIVVPEGKTLTIDLNGQNVTAVNNHAITNNGILTIVGTGTVDGGSVSGKGAIYNSPGSTATLNGGTFTGNTWYVIKNLGSMTINAGFSLVQNDAGSSAIDNGYYGNSSNDCGVARPQSAEVTLTINGGTFFGGMNTVKNDDFGVLEISGGDFSNTNGPTVLNWHRATISGGTFTVNNASMGVLANGYLSENADAGQLTITGGTFTASDSGVLFTYPQGASKGGSIDVEGGTFTGKLVIPGDNNYPSVPSISGGTFNVDVSGFLAQGVQQNEDGSVAEIPVIAMIGEREYPSLEAAAAVVQPGETIVLAQDAVIKQCLVVDQDKVTIDGAGHTITAADDVADNGGQTSLVTVTGQGFTIKDAKLVGTADTKHVLNIWRAGTASIEDVTLDHSASGVGAPLIINKTDVTVSGSFDVIAGANSWYGINLDNKYGDTSLTFAVDSKPTFTDNSGKNLAYIQLDDGAGTGPDTVPTVYSDNAAVELNTTDRANAFSLHVHTFQDGVCTDCGDVHPDYHKVTLVYGNGQADGTFYVAPGAAFAEPVAPAWEGHVFAGWYTQVAADGVVSGRYDFSTAVTSDITLYAGWYEAGSQDNEPSAPGAQAGQEEKPSSGKLTSTGDASLLGLILVGGAGASALGAGAFLRRRK